MSEADFLDTNILVYAFSTDPRADQASDLLRTGCTVGVQGLNEFANVARRKLAMSWNEVEQALDAIRTLCVRVEPVTLEIHEHALRLARRHDFSMFDALMLAAALGAGCRTFWSEDLQHGMRIDGSMIILNPFAGG